MHSSIYDSGSGYVNLPNSSPSSRFQSAPFFLIFLYTSVTLVSHHVMTYHLSPLSLYAEKELFRSLLLFWLANVSQVSYGNTCYFSRTRWRAGFSDHQGICDISFNKVFIQDATFLRSLSLLPYFQSSFRSPVQLGKLCI